MGFCPHTGIVIKIFDCLQIYFGTVICLSTNTQCGFFYKTYRFSRKFSHYSRRCGNLPPMGMRSIFLSISALARLQSRLCRARLRSYGGEPSAKRWWRILLSRKRFIIRAEGTRISNGLPLILASLHTVAPLVRERLWRSRTLRRSTCRTVPLSSKRGTSYGDISAFLSFKVICVNRLLKTM